MAEIAFFRHLATMLEGGRSELSAWRHRLAAACEALLVNQRDRLSFAGGRRRTGRDHDRYIHGAQGGN